MSGKEIIFSSCEKPIQEFIANFLEKPPSELFETVIQTKTGVEFKTVEGNFQLYIDVVDSDYIFNSILMKYIQFNKTIQQLALFIRDVYVSTVKTMKTDSKLMCNVDLHFDKQCYSFYPQYHEIKGDIKTDVQEELKKYKRLSFVVIENSSTETKENTETIENSSTETKENTETTENNPIENSSTENNTITTNLDNTLLKSTLIQTTIDVEAIIADVLEKYK